MRTVGDGAQAAFSGARDKSGGYLMIFCVKLGLVDAPISWRSMPGHFQGSDSGGRSD